MIGDVGIEEELKLKGINYIGGPSDADQKVELSAGYALPHDPDVSSIALQLYVPKLYPHDGDQVCRIQGRKLCAG